MKIKSQLKRDGRKEKEHYVDEAWAELYLPNKHICVGMASPKEDLVILEFVMDARVYEIDLTEDEATVLLKQLSRMLDYFEEYKKGNNGISST